MLERSKAANTIAAGYIDVFAGSQAVANSNGLFAYHASTGVASTLTVRTPDGSSSGWAGDEGADWTTIESERIATDALAKCEAWRGKTALDPGTYEVVLEPTAVGMLMSRMMGAFDARSAEEGRSYFSKRGGGTLLGEKVFDERVTITSDPAFENGETAPFTQARRGDRGGNVGGERRAQEPRLLAILGATGRSVASKPGMSNFIMAGRRRDTRGLDCAR